MHPSVREMVYRRVNGVYDPTLVYKEATATRVTATASQLNLMESWGRAPEIAPPALAKGPALTVVAGVFSAARAGVELVKTNQSRFCTAGQVTYEAAMSTGGVRVEEVEVEEVEDDVEVLEVEEEDLDELPSSLAAALTRHEEDWPGLIVIWKCQDI